MDLPPAARWMQHPQRDDYWCSGSVCEDYGRITVPVLAVGGWAEGYTNTVLRLLENLRGPRKGLIGPWGHFSPHCHAGAAHRFYRLCPALVRSVAKRARDRHYGRIDADLLATTAGAAPRPICAASGSLGGGTLLALRRRPGAHVASGARSAAGHAGAIYRNPEFPRHHGTGVRGVVPLRLGTGYAGGPARG